MEPQIKSEAESETSDLKKGGKEKMKPDIKKTIEASMKTHQTTLDKLAKI